MNDELGLGFVTGHAVGRIMKEAVRRACVAIRNERDTFEAHSKQHYSGTMDDVVTSADLKAQEIYARIFRECFPDCGVIAEERGLIIEPKNGCTAYFTVDPLDGAKAYVRRQSHGISTMAALVDCGRVIAAYIGDVNAEEVYGFRPGSESVHRITRLDTFARLNDVGAPKKGLSEAAALLRVSTAPENRATWRSKKGPGGARKVRHWLSLCTHGKGPRGGPFHVRRRFGRAQALRISPVSGSMVSAVSAGCPARRFRADEVFNR